MNDKNRWSQATCRLGVLPSLRTKHEKWAWWWVTPNPWQRPTLGSRNRANLGEEHTEIPWMAFQKLECMGLCFIICFLSGTYPLYILFVCIMCFIINSKKYVNLSSRCFILITWDEVLLSSVHFCPVGPWVRISPGAEMDGEKGEMWLPWIVKFKPLFSGQVTCNSFLWPP